MKHSLLAASLAFAAFVSASPALAICSSCNIQTKTPSATEPGKFDYRVSCIIDESGDEVNRVNRTWSPFRLVGRPGDADRPAAAVARTARPT